MRAITLDGFERTFAADPDPWRTFTSHDEAVKRQAILRAIGAGPCGRVLELAAGNGSNSVAIARRALRLHATEATEAGTRLVERALVPFADRAKAIRLKMPAPLGRWRYDVVVLAELLYYLSPRAMQRTAREVADALRPGGTLVLAHHHIDFHDFAQHARHLHRDFLSATGVDWRTRTTRRTGRWAVIACIRTDR